MFRDDGKKFQIFIAVIQEGMGASFRAVVNNSRREYLFLAVAEGGAFSGGNEDYLAGGFVAVLADGMAGGKTAENYFVVPIRLYMGEKLPFAAFEAGKALGREAVLCYQHGGSSIPIQLEKDNRASADYTASENDISGVKHHGLAGSDGSHRGVKPYADPSAGKQGHGGGTALMAVADFGGDFQETFGREAVDPVYLLSRKLPGEYAVCLAHYNPVVFRIQGFDEKGFAVGDAETFSLSDGVERNSLMMSQYLAAFVEDFPRLQAGGVMGFDEGVIIIVGDKADFLTFPFLGHRQAKFGRQLPHLGLRVVTQGEMDMVNGFLSELVEHIGLVFLLVNGSGQTVLAAFVGQNAGVVAGGHALAAKTGGNISQFTELYVTVTKNTGVGSQPRAVLSEKGLDNLDRKFLPQVCCMVADAENVADPAGVVQGGGGFSRPGQHRPVFVCKYQGYADYLVSLLL